MATEIPPPAPEPLVSLAALLGTSTPPLRAWLEREGYGDLVVVDPLTGEAAVPLSVANRLGREARERRSEK